MSKKIWLGNTRHAQWVPCPASGAQKSRERRVEELAFYNGGKWVDQSAAGANRYTFDFPVADQRDYEGIEAFQRFRDGDYGEDFLRFVDPMVADQNLFTPEWAAPGLAEEGWKAIYDTEPSFSATDPADAASYRFPLRAAEYTITDAADSVPTGKNSVFTLLIPPSGNLWLKWFGSRTGDAVLRVDLYDRSGALDSTVDLTPAATSSAPSYSGSGFSGASYAYAKIYFTRSASTSSSFQVTSIVAQINYVSSAPVLGRHIPGKGHHGLRFSNAAQLETYVMQDRHLTGGAIELVEVEPWR